MAARVEAQGSVGYLIEPRWPADAWSRAGYVLPRLEQHAWTRRRTRSDRGTRRGPTSSVGSPSFQGHPARNSSGTPPPLSRRASISTRGTNVRLRPSRELDPRSSTRSILVKEGVDVGPLT